MRPFSFAVVALCLSIPTSVALAEPTDYDYLKRQLDQVNGEIDKVRQKIRDEVKHAKAEEPDSPANWENVIKAVDGHIGPNELKNAVEETELAGAGVPIYAKEIRDKYLKLREPLDTIDAQVKAKEAKYDHYKKLGGWDFFGATRPYGAYSDEMRQLLAEIEKLKQQRKRKKAEIDRQIAADSDLGHYENLEKLEAGVSRVYQEYYDKIFGASSIEGLSGANETRVFRIKKLLAELAQLVARRDRLQALLQSGEMWVVWANDVGWAYVGTKDMYARQKHRTRGSETWGGRSTEPLKSELLLNRDGYATMKQAIAAVGAQVGKAEFRRNPLAFPKFHYEGTIGGKKLKLKDMITSHPEFEKHMP
jgi:hypothetical protein